MDWRSGGLAAIDIERGAGDVTRVRTDEERHCRGDILRLAVTAECCELVQRFRKRAIAPGWMMLTMMLRGPKSRDQPRV